MYNEAVPASVIEPTPRTIPGSSAIAYLFNVCRQMNLNFSGQKIKECLANLV